MKCLLLSHAFNMDGRAASLTVTDKLPYLQNHGWELFVLSAVTGSRDKQVRHRQIIGVGPSALRFDLRHWIAMRVGRGTVYRLTTALLGICLFPFVILEKALLGLSSQWSWSLLAFLQGFIWIKRFNIELIYTSGGAWSAHLAGFWLSKVTRLPWIVELHDPLVDASLMPFVKTISQGQSREVRFKATLERLICKNATLVWWFTEGAFQNALLRNPELSGKGFYVLPGVAKPKVFARYQRERTFNLSHFGSLSNTRSLTPLVEGLKEFFHLRPEVAGIIKVHIYGSTLDERSKQAISSFPTQDIFVLHGRVETENGVSGRDRILELMQKTDFLVLLHGETDSCSEYIPSKLYEYWWAGRPVIGFSHKNQQLERLLEQVNGCSELTVNGNNKLIDVLNCAYARWEGGIYLKNAGNPITPESAVDEIVKRVNRKIDEKAHIKN